MGEIMKQRRAALGLSQADLAESVGVDKRQIRRYEAGDQQPVLSVALAIANALKISLSELAGVPAHQVQLNGDWWAAWQTFKDGEEVITAQEVRFSQQGDLIDMRTLTRGIEIEDGGYHWRGELRLWDNAILMGWYVAIDGSVRSKGVLYFVLHPHGLQMAGRWIGLSYDDKIVTGWGGIARTEGEARDVINELKTEGIAK